MLHIDFMSLKNWSRDFALKASSICHTRLLFLCWRTPKCLAYDMGIEGADTVLNSTSFSLLRENTEHVDLTAPVPLDI